MKRLRNLTFGLGFGLGLVALALPSWAQSMRPVPRPASVEEAAAPAVPEAETAVETSDGLAPLVATLVPMPRPDGLMTGREIRLALAMGAAGDWQEAAKVATASGPVAVDIIEWQRLRSGKGDFADYRAFLARNGDWPGLDLLRSRGEASIPEAAAAVHVLEYFAKEPPQTAQGILRLAAAHMTTGAADKAQEVVITGWTTLKMSPGDEADFLAAHGEVLKSHHATRLDHLLWENHTAEAKRMLALVNKDWQALATARLALQQGGSNVDALIKAVPAALAGDGGLAHDRMQWQIKKRRRDEAGDMILATSTSADALGQPEEWANWRRILARQAMRDGDGKRAYDLASNHYLEPGSNFADLEWLSGYLALRYLKDPELALSHFQRFRSSVFTPISLGRAGYWEGRALDELNDPEAALAAYKDAAQYQTAFYGLLASEKAGVPMDPILTGASDLTPWEDTAFAKTSVFRAAQLFADAGQLWETGRFLSHLTETVAPEERLPLSDYALSHGDGYLAVRVGKQIAQTGDVTPRAYYPVTDLGPDELPVTKALALSIARRESEFHVGAISHAGARGLMQLMPATAKSMAGKMGLPYSQARLTTDGTYNATLGSAYLAQLINEFGENYVLVSVGYNAGPSRARSWIEDRGDPRDPNVDVIDWIEHIPFRETRNYVMRVTESIPIYRARLTGKTVPITLSTDLKSR